MYSRLVPAKLAFLDWLDVIPVQEWIIKKQAFIYYARLLFWPATTMEIQDRCSYWLQPAYVRSLSKSSCFNEPVQVTGPGLGKDAP